MALFRSNIQGGLPYTKCTITGTLSAWSSAYWNSADRATQTRTSTVTIVIDLTDGTYTISGNSIPTTQSSNSYTTQSGGTLRSRVRGSFTITSINFS